MYLDSIYENEGYSLSWRLLNIVAGRGAGKSYQTRQLAEKVALYCDASVAMVFEDKYKLEYICGEYFSEWKKDTEFSIVKPGWEKKVFLYPQKDDCFMEKTIDLLIVDDALEIKTKHLEGYLNMLESGQVKRIITNFHNKKCKQSEMLLWHEEARNLFLYSRDYLGQLDCPKFINLFKKHGKEK
ncbi:MAG TPA: hypothetical protein PLP33_27075 [Leptospiraceae bacterium]|nr:hypothetical protein [Leptospiraceae bacterium]